MNKILGDYHTHTTYSHGKGSVLDNAIEAKNRGLKEIAITDHGFGHLLYGVKRRDLPKMRSEIEKAEQQTGVKIYMGVEANFTSTKGDIDVTEEDLKNLDILLVGFHRFVKSKLKDKFLFFLPNILTKGKVSKKVRLRNTNAILQAMDKYPIDILTHLGYEIGIDLMKIAKKAVETKTLIELNENKLLFSKEQIDKMVKIGVKFIIDSDAHKPQNVGVVNYALSIVEKFNIPKKNIVNLDKLPKFKKEKNKKNNKN